MQKIMNQRSNLWQALKDLDFLSAFFSWFFMLLTRLSEPLMLLATLYVVAETGVPVIALPVLHNLSVGIMITAPEIILPGAFVVASRAKEYARWLYTICWIFILLTFTTLISLFVWHFTGLALSSLMFARCATAVGYSILMRVMNHSKKGDQVQTIAVPHIQAPMIEQISGKLDTIHTTFATRIDNVEKTLEYQMAVNALPKSVPLWEQCGSFPIQGNVPEMLPESVWELVEYGTPSLPEKEMEMEHDDGTQETLLEEPFEEVKQAQIMPESVPQNSGSFRATGQATMTLEEAAQELGYSVKWVRKLRDNRNLKKSPRNPDRVTTESVKKWAETHPKREQVENKPVLRIVTNS